MKYFSDETVNIAREQSSRQVKKRSIFKDNFRRISIAYGGESRRTRRSIAWDKTRRDIQSIKSSK